MAMEFQNIFPFWEQLKKEEHGEVKLFQDLHQQFQNNGVRY